MGVHFNISQAYLTRFGIPGQGNKNGKISKFQANEASYYGSALHSSPTPLISLKIQVPGGVKGFKHSLATARALPDTGASCDCISEAFAVQHGLQIVPDTDNLIDLSAAEGNPIEVSGTTEITIIGHQGIQVKSLALVCARLSNTLLLSWGSQKRLRMLHRNWPFAVVQEETAFSATACSAQVRCSVPKQIRRKNSKTQIPTEWPPVEFPEKIKEVLRQFPDVL